MFQSAISHSKIKRLIIRLYRFLFWINDNTLKECKSNPPDLNTMAQFLTYTSLKIIDKQYQTDTSSIKSVSVIELREKDKIFDQKAELKDFDEKQGMGDVMENIIKSCNTTLSKPAEKPTSLAPKIKELSTESFDEEIIKSIDFCQRKTSESWTATVDFREESGVAINLLDFEVSEQTLCLKFNSETVFSKTFPFALIPDKLRVKFNKQTQRLSINYGDN